MNLPFSVYDFFAYLATGFVLLAAADYSFDGHWLLKDDLPPVYLVVFTVFAYILGHIVANLSSYLIEHKFLRGVLTPPEETLFADAPPPTPWAKVFPVFHKPFPAETRKWVLEKARAAGIDRPGRGLFFHCHPLVMRDDHARERLNTFLNLYGFCRNTAMASLLAVPILTAGMIASFRWAKALWALVALGVAVGLLFRYLKFFKHYTEEVFRNFAVMDDSGPE